MSFYYSGAVKQIGTEKEKEAENTKARPHKVLTLCEKVLKEEMEIGMRLLGVKHLDELGPEFLDCSKL